MDVEFLRYKYEDGSEGIVTKTKFKIGVRHLQMLYMFVISVVLGMMRGSLGITLQAINDENRLNETYIEIHNWGRKAQATVFSSFLFGYGVMLIPAELCLSRSGSKMMITSVLAINGGLSAAMPNIVNRGGWIAVCNTQFLLGMSQAFLAPANRVLIENWMPPNEKNIFSSIVCGGAFLGTILALPCAGALSTARLGWELICYAQAMAALSACVVWALLTASAPRQHQAVGDDENEYIEEAKGFCKKKPLSIPWRGILRSSSFWALVGAHAASNAIFVFFLVDVPYYLQMLGMSLKDASVQAMLPFIGMWVTYLATAPTIEWLHNTGFMSYVLNTTYYRKLINALGAFGTVIALSVASNLRAGSLSVILLIGSMSLLGFQFSGYLENHRSLSQNFSGTLVMLTSAAAGILGAGVPLVTGIIIGNDPTDFNRWRAVFLTLASFSVVCNAIYTAFGRGERASWDRLEGNKFGYHNDANQLELEELSVPKSFQKDIDRPILEK